MLDGEELYDLKYKEATELINHLLNIGEDIFDISDGKKEVRKPGREHISNSEKESYIKLERKLSKLS